MIIENRIVKYLLYALGEIILVIVGILIALTINNKNELRKNETKVEILLKQVQKDLLIDIESADLILNVYADKDSLMNRVLFGMVTEEEFLSNSEYFSLITTVAAFKIKDNSYQNLMRSGDIISSRFDSVIPIIDNLYFNNRAGVDEINKALTEFTSSVLEKWSSQHPWYSGLFFTELPQEALDFFVSDPFYKNDVSIYQTYAVQNLMAMAANYKVGAVLAYKAIAQEIDPNAPLPIEISSFMADLTQKELQLLEGVYAIAPTFKIKITAEGKHIMAQATGQSKFELYAKSDTVLFSPTADIKLFFTKSEEGNITGFELIQSGNKNYFFKEEANQ